MRIPATAIVVTSSLLWVSLGWAQQTSSNQQRTFTTDADFAQGTFDGTRARAPDSNELRLDTGARQAPFLWVTNATSGTVTKVDTRTGKQVARYDSVLTRNWDGSMPPVRTPRDACNNPVLAAVDVKGDVFVLNRANCNGTYAAVSKYAGSLAACVDRNGNGVINTSTDANGDGIINTSDPAEFLNQTDECILWTKTFAVAEDQGRALVVDAGQNVWVSTASAKLFRLSGQSGQVVKTIDVAAETGVTTSSLQALAVGPGGFLYASDSSSQRRVRKIDPNASPGGHVVDSLVTPVPTFGITVARNGVVWLGAESDSANGVIRVDFTARTAQMVGGGGGCVGRIRGVTVDTTGDIWAACVNVNRLLRVSPSGGFLGSWVVGSRPEGVAVAADKKIWVVNSDSDTLSVINPAATSTIQTFPAGGLPLTHSDMTGFHQHQFVLRQGTWRAVHDSGQVQAHWGTLTWNQEAQGATPPGTSIVVAVRAADTQEALASRIFTPVVNGQHFVGVDGRFLEVQVTLSSANFSGEPVLSDLTIAPYNNAPVALCQDRNVCAGPVCTAQVSVDNGSYDPDGDAISRAQSPAGPYGIGARPVSLTVSDATLSASCSANVRVRDCEPPAITCAVPVQAECTGNGAAHVAVSEAQATDACSAVSVSGPGSGSYPLGTTPLSYTATDAEGNTAVCSSSVKVVDTQAPTHVLNGDAALALECGVSYVEQGSTATDVCANVSGAVRITGTVSPGQLGVHTRRYNVADPSGNSGPELTRTVTVSDTQAPVLVLTGGTAQTLECGSSYEEQGYTAQDVCAGDLALSVQIIGTVDGTKTGIYTRRYNVADPSGNNAPEQTRTVTVSDTRAPVLALRGDAAQTLECGSTYTEQGYTAEDICAGNLARSVRVTGSVNVAQPGNYPLSYDVKDPSGNAALTAVRTVTVADTQAPTLVLNGEPSITHECATIFEDPRATAVDACLGPISHRVTIAGAVDVAVPGLYELTYNVADTSGNAAPAVSRTVRVRDSVGPAITLNGANPLPIECKRDTYAEPGATVADACTPGAGNSLVIEHQPIDPAVLGNYPVTYRATDGAGNVATALRQVQVRDTLPPELTLNGQATVRLECKVDTYSEPGAVATDVCTSNLPPVTITGTVDPGVLGGQPVRYRVQDGNGLVTEKVRDVRVVDTRPPTLTVEAGPLPEVECSRGAFIDLGASAEDHCAGDITDRIVITGTQNITVPGDYPITFSVTDLAGNAAPSITRTVKVKDTKAPAVTILGQANMDLECGVDTYTELGATAYDACQGDVTRLVQTYGNGANPDAVGTYSIEYGVWDAAGNTTKALRTVKVSDRLPPVLSLVGAAAMQHECASGVFEDPGATAADECFGNLTPSITKQGFVNAWALGTYTLTYNVQDSALLKATPITRTVQVVDTQPPTLEARTVAATPPDHTMRTFTLADCVTANDSCDGWANANNGQILSIYSDEPEDVPDDSDGSTTEDIVITGKSSFKVRAERQQGGNGRVYGVRFELKDITGNSRAGMCRIVVPANEVAAAEDSGESSGYTVHAPPPPVASLGAP
jgi:YVTN family beta-propeller protein